MQQRTPGYEPSAASISSAVISPMLGIQWLYLSSVMLTLECPRRCCTMVGWTLRWRSKVAAV